MQRMEMKIEEGLIRELCLEASEVQKLLEINEKLVCRTPIFASASIYTLFIPQNYKTILSKEGQG